MAPPAPARTIRGRLSGLTAGGLVSAVPNDDVGRDRVVNTVELGRYDAAASFTRVGNVFGTYDVFTTNITVGDISIAQLTATGVADGDQLLVFAVMETNRYPFAGSTTPPSAAGLYNSGEGSGGRMYRLTAGVETWPQSAPYTASMVSDQVSINYVNIVAMILRSGEPATRLTAGAQVEAGTLLVAAVQLTPPNTVGVSVTSVTPPAGWTLVPGTFTNEDSGVTANSERRRSLRLATRIADFGEVISLGEWSATTSDGSVSTGNTEVVIGIAIKRAIVWSAGRSYTLAPNETIFVAAGANEPFTDVVTPSEGTDFVVDAGSITAALIATLRTATSVTILITAGANGASISGLQLRGSEIVRDVTSDVTAVNAASVAAWGPRRARLMSWPYLDTANAQALADEIVSYGAQPRRSWSVRLDADRDADTLAAVCETELGDVLTCNIDSVLNQDGEVVRLEYLIGESGTLGGIHDVSRDRRRPAGADHGDSTG